MTRKCIAENIFQNCDITLLLFYRLSRSHIDVGDRHETEVINIKNCHSGLGKLYANLDNRIVSFSFCLSLKVLIHGICIGRCKSTG